MVGLLLLAATAAPARAQTIGQTVRRVDSVLTRVGVILAEWFGRSIPLPVAAPGVTFRFDPETGAFERESAVTGQLYVDRADTLGAKRLHLGLGYEHVVLDRLAGQPVDSISGGFPIRLQPGKAIGLELGDPDLSAMVEHVTPSATYGVTDDLDVGLTVPLVYTDLRVVLPLRLAALVDTPGGPRPARVSDSLRGATDAWGFGDVILHAKQRLLANDVAHVAARLVTRFPTGDEEELRGTGNFEVEPSLLASTRAFTPASWARLQGHWNGGANLNAADVGASELRWGLGLDWTFVEGTTAAVAVLGRHPLRRLAPPGRLDFPRCGPTLAGCLVAGGLGQQPLFGFDGSRPDYYDLSLGGRVSLWRDTVMCFANVIVPLNDAGVRTEPIPLVGVEATF